MFSDKKAIEEHYSHHTQTKMRRRVELLISLIEDSGADGISQKKLEENFLVQGIGEPALVRKYLKYLIGFGKIVAEGTLFYSSNIRTVQTKFRIADDETPEVHTHTSHTQQGGEQ
jgi:hypothetical protein